MAQLIIPNIPSYYRLDDTPSFDSCTQRSIVVEIKPAMGSDINSTSAFSFDYQGQTFVRLGSPRSGFRVKASIVTKSRANDRADYANDRNANITLASNWFFHLFGKIELQGGEILECIDKPGECLDIICHLKGLDVRQRSGENIGFIPDEGVGTATTSLSIRAHTAVDNPAAAAAADIAATANAAATAAIAAVTAGLNGDFNAGYRRRFKKYNRTVAADNTARKVEIFIPNTTIFGYCDTYDMVTKYMPFSATFTRVSGTDVNNSIFGAANTTMTIHLDELTWILDTYEPKPEVALALNNRYAQGPLSVNYLRRYISSAISDQPDVSIQTTAFSQPRYVFIVCKGTTGAASQTGPDSNYSLCRNCNIEDIRVSLDGKWYPDKDYKTDFGNDYFSHFYEAYANICETFSGSCGVTPKEFKELYTIFCIDLNDQVDKLPNSKVNLTIEIKRRSVPDDDANPSNPRNVKYFYMVLDEAHFAMDCVKKTSTKI